MKKVFKDFKAEKKKVKVKMKTYVEKLSGPSTKHDKQKITIKENMQTINNSCLEEQQPTINQFPKINKVPQINHNNVGTSETLEQVREMHQIINQLQEILEQDRKNLFGPENNLLFVHNQLLQLDLSRVNTMQEASTASQYIINTLRSYFSRLDEFSDYFTNYLWELSENLILLAKNGQASTIIVDIIKIIEIEEAADERAKNQRDSGLKIIRMIKSYKSNFLQKVLNSITKSFEEKRQKYKESPLQLLDKLESKIFDDLIIVKDEIDPLFPSNNYNIMSLFVFSYHQNVYECIEEILQNDPNIGIILRLIRLVRHYYTFMEKKMNISEDLMEPNLLNGKEQSLIDDYINLVSSKFQEWKINLMESDIKEFTQRQNIPELVSKNSVGLPGAPILISIVRQQIDLATDSANYQLLTGVINECCKIMSEIQQTWINLLKSELQKHWSDEESAADLIICIIALANDQLIFSDFTDALSKQFALSLPEEYINNISIVLDDLINGFSNVATNAINTILDIIYYDLKKPFRELYTARWYKGNTMDLIVSTLKDYIDEECHSYLKPLVFDKLMISMLNRFVIAIIESMRNKAAKFRMPHCVNKMRKDILLISEFFGQYIGVHELNSQLDVIYRLHDFLGSPKESICEGYCSLRQFHGDVPRKYLKIILSKRDDINLIAMRNINKILKDKAAEAGEYNGEQTVFSKIIVKDLEETELKDDIQEALRNVKLRSVKTTILLRRKGHLLK